MVWRVEEIVGWGEVAGLGGFPVRGFLATGGGGVEKTATGGGGTGGGVVGGGWRGGFGAVRGAGRFKGEGIGKAGEGRGLPQSGPRCGGCFG